MPGPPADLPIGLRLSRTASAVTQALERELAAAGGSVATWQVLLLVRGGSWGAQARIADALGVTPATLTHHLAALERRGLVRRWREPGDRRVQQVELTPEGEALFGRLRAVAVAHDARLRAALDDEELDRLGALLDRLRAAVEA
ncbi:MAG: MarR family transcriptional regulator [Solirubrobacteraceae bacterium]|nr:MarR family transcriptional regulator [Solirubrobacteraceae bacterium]